MSLHISPALDLPLDAITETFAILAKRGTGKSNAAVVMAEEMYDNGLPWVAIDPKGDWWGVRSAGDGRAPGLAVLVFGGQHGDVPLEPTAGRLVADLIVEQRLTCVLDVSEMTKADQRRFLVEFADRLYRRNTEPLHVFCEEADEYIPQRVMGENAKLVGAFETLVKRGRTHGLGITLITQRSASLNKDVLTQIETLVALRTPSPQDRKAILAWVDVHAAGAEAVDTLPGLANGEAYVFSPQWLDILQRITFRRRRTFDSGATPKVGQRVRPPTALAEVDLASIKEAMAATIEKAKAEDPRHLRAEVARLTRELAEQPAPQVERVEVPVLPPADITQLFETMTTLGQLLGDVQQRLEVIAQLPAAAKEGGGQSPMRQVTSTTPGTATSGKNPAGTAGDAPRGPAGQLGKTERRILSVLAQHGPRTHLQLALQTGYSQKASTIGVSLGKLRRLGYVADGQPITATAEGVAALGPYDPLPTGPALLDYWRAQFGKTENAVLTAFLDTWPAETNQAEVAEATGYSPTASTIGVSLGKLRRLGLIEGWRISDDFARSIR